MVSRLLLAAVVLAGCDYGFRPETLVDGMRLLGVRATPPDLVPGQSATLEALVPDPSRAEPATLLWLGCDADPFNQNRSPCADTRLLSDPGAITGGTGELPEGVRLIGFNSQATYATPATLLDVYPPGDPARERGTVGLVVLFAVAETVSPTASQAELEALFQRVQQREVRSVVALYRLPIFEGGERNTDPGPATLTVDGAAVPAGAHLGVVEGRSATVDLAVDPSSFEPYTRVTPTGAQAETERILVAWYSTTGRFSQDRTTLTEEVKAVLSAPGGADPTDVVPPRREGTLWAVLRDTRGGQSWQSWPMYICEPDGPAVTVSSVEWPGPGSRVVTVRGQNLDGILDVVVDDVALEAGAYSPARQTWEGLIPAAVDIGQPRGRLHTRRCQWQPLLP